MVDHQGNGDEAQAQTWNIGVGDLSKVLAAARDINITYGPPPWASDIDIDLRHEKDEIPITPGTRTNITVAISNHGSEARELELEFRGIGAGAETAKPRVTVEPGKPAISIRVSLECGPQTPAAGSGSIVLKATDVAEPTRFWLSQPRKVRVLANRHMKLEVKGALQAAPAPDTHRVAVLVTNAGNTDFKGRLRATEPDPTLRRSLAADAQVLDAVRARAVESLDLGPTQSTTVQLLVKLPERQFLDRRWHIALRPDSEEPAKVEPSFLQVTHAGYVRDLEAAAAALWRWAKRPVTMPRGITAALSVLVIVLGLLVCSGVGSSGGHTADPFPTYRSKLDTGPSDRGSSSAAVVPAGDAGELSPFFADWPGLSCVDDQQGAGPTGKLCAFGGIELYLWMYATQDARDNNRSKNAAAAARANVCAAGSRSGKWSRPDGRGGNYVEYSITVGTQCWARIWWDDGDTSSANAGALLLSAKWDADLHSSWDVLRAIWASHGYQFTG